MRDPLDLSAARRLTEAELASVSPLLARIAAGDLVDAYDGPGGTFIVHARATQIFVCTLDNDGPTMVEVYDLHGWSLEFAVPAAHALAAGAIEAKDNGNGCLEISETDSDRAYDSHRAEPPTGLLQRKFRSAEWGVPRDGLDFALRIHGLWDDDKTTLTLLLGHDFAPFERLYYRFNDGTLTTVDTGAFARDWQGVERFEAALRRHLPDARIFEDDGTAWSAAASRSRLEGRERAEVNLNFHLAGTLLFGRLIAKRDDGQLYHLVIMAKPPR